MQIGWGLSLTSITRGEDVTVVFAALIFVSGLSFDLVAGGPLFLVEA